jgi:hypothetical protein
MTEDLQSVLKDYRDNERDIKMCQLAIEGQWSTVSYPRGLLVQCLEMRPLIAKKIVELGGQVPGAIQEPEHWQNAFEAGAKSHPGYSDEFFQALLCQCGETITLIEGPETCECGRVYRASIAIEVKEPKRS